MRNRVAGLLAALAFVGIVVAIEMETNPDNKIEGWLAGVAVIAVVFALIIWEA